MSASASESDVGSAFRALVEDAIAQNRPDLVPDAMLGEVLASALRAHAFKSDKAGHGIAPYARGALTATETVVAATAILRAADLNLWDVAMWFNRPGSDPAARGGRGE